MKAKFNKEETFFKSFNCKYSTQAGGSLKKDYDGYQIEVGEFEGFASTYGNIDLVNDTVIKGAFTKTIKDKGGKISICHQHNREDLLGLGMLTDDVKGLLMHGALNMAVKRSVEDFSLMKQGVLDSLSIGYNIIDAEFDKSGVLMLKELRLNEVSLVDNPADIEAAILGIKSFNSNPSAFIEKKIMDLYRSLVNVKDRGFDLQIDDSLLSSLSDEVKSLSTEDCSHVLPDIIHNAKDEAQKKEAENKLLIKGLDAILNNLTFNEVE